MLFPGIQLSREDNRSLYLQVADQLRVQIENGTLTPETRLPASRVLAKKLGVNRITIVNAYAELEAEGLVATRMGSGTYVTTLKEIPAARTRQWRSPFSLRRQWSPSQMMAEMMRMARQPGVISFAAGTPASEFIPVNEFRRALNDVLRRDGADALQYEEAIGYLPLREIIAQALQDQNIRVNSSDVLITAGCQQAVDIALRVLAPEEGSTLLVEEPCYLGLLDLVTTRHIVPVGVPIDQHGLQINHLEQIILRHRPCLIYVSPSFHNPTGLTMPLERRRALLDIAGRYGIPILEDTIYDELYYDEPPLPSLKSLDTADIVFQAGGYSKTLIPGIRIGYLVGPATLQDRLIATKQTTDILTSPLNQRALHAYLETGHYAQHLQFIRGAYKARRDAMLAAMAQHFPAEAQWHIPKGGLYLWIEMPTSGPTATELYLTAINYNVAFSIGSVFSASGSFIHAMRLTFATCSPEEIKEGIRRLGKAWKELLTRTAPADQANFQRSTVHIL